VLQCIPRPCRVPAAAPPCAKDLQQCPRVLLRVQQRPPKQRQRPACAACSSTLPKVTRAAAPLLCCRACSSAPTCAAAVPPCAAAHVAAPAPELQQHPPVPRRLQQCPCVLLRVEQRPPKQHQRPVTFCRSQPARSPCAPAPVRSSKSIHRLRTRLLVLLPPREDVAAGRRSTCRSDVWMPAGAGAVLAGQLE
jgi:ribosomal protein L37AE/L43A